ncbi:CBS domain-containing protein [Methanofervidicoccus sp. A16]|uniref:CBS domain-containing protein n=1 Tax=Methanofervidicoccus sp. A16 TaxID=2607662 RepID=UPI00118878FC|nr:CBS domain-containing protein [Methanofervidicoccus sp. A16]AXI24909.1 CBS domain-containing protein [Methanofervidicoccus sp. A16]
MRVGDVIKDKKDVIKVYPSTTIRDAVSKMNNSGSRRVPVVDAGTDRIEGIVTSMDILDFMGGGNKYNLVKFKHDHNLLSAINEPVKEIMTSNPVCVRESTPLDEVIDIFVEKNVGGTPVIDKEDILISIITERDVIRHLIDKIEGKTVQDYMTEDPIVATPGMRLKDVARVMLRNGFRRLPVVSEDRLVGMVTSTDFIRLLGSDWAFNRMTTGNVREITNVRVEEVMAKDPVKVSREDSLRSVAEIMINKGIGALPVVEDKDNLVGVITEKDIVAFLREIYS